MDHSNQLLYRNAELQAELRLVKEQLDHAHTSTTYLLERMSLAETPRTNVELKRLQKEYENVLRENAHLRAILGVTREGRLPTSRRIGSRTSYGVRRTLRPCGGHSSASYTCGQAADGAAGEQGHLLDLEDEDSPSATAEPAYTAAREGIPRLDESDDETRHFPDIPEAVGRPVRHHKAGNTSIDLGISATSSFTSLETETSEAHAGTATRPSTGRRHGFMTYDSDGNPSFFHTPSPKSPIAPSGPRTGRGQRTGPTPFASHEHTRLLGAATYVEDMDEAEQQEHWVRYGSENPRHSAGEWKAYYDEKIRPAFLAKQSPKSNNGEQQGELRAEEERQTEERAEIEEVQEREDEPARLPATSFTSCATNSDEILLDDEEEVTMLMDSSFDNTTTSSGGVALLEDRIHALEKAEVSAEGRRDSLITVSAQQSENILEPAPARAPAVNPLALSIYADPRVVDNELEREHVILADETEYNEPVAKADRALENSTRDSATKSKNPWSSGPAYDKSLLEAREFLKEATPAGQRQSRPSRPRLQSPEDDNLVAPATPAFGSIARRDGQGETPPPRASPPKSTRCGFSRGYYPTSLTDLFYNPHAEDPNTYRTVLIANVPPTVTLAQVLDKVRGGKIFSASYHETASFKTSPPTATNTVTIIFLEGSQARSFVEHTRSHPINFEPSLIEAPLRASVSLISTPTRPISDRLRHQAIPAGLTRVLYLHDLPKDLQDPNKVVAKIQKIDASVPWPLKAGCDEDGVMVLEYASMVEAEMAWMVVNHRAQEFPGVSTGLLGDPCEGPLERKGGKAKEDEGENHLKGEGEDAPGGEAK